MSDDMESESGGGDEGGGLPAWVMTFADLMSLLMCFFVLLLAFSEMDVQKFKQLAGSMKEAFGIQRDVKVKDIPKGTSIIAQEFSPGKPTVTVVNEVRQQTTDETKQNLDFGNEKKKYTDLEQAKADLMKELEKKIQKEAEAIKEVLKEDIEKGILEILTQGDEVMIRIRERGSFSSGSAVLQKTFLPILARLGRVLKNVDGKILVSGHTDNVPIFTSQYPSNWVLSAARAATVVHNLTKYAKVPNDKMEIRAHADTLSLVKNDSAINKAKNRRVEIIIKYEGLTEIDVENKIKELSSQVEIQAMMKDEL